MAADVSSQLTDFLLLLRQLVVAVEQQHGLPQGLPVHVTFDETLGRVTIGVQRDGTGQQLVQLDANIESPTFGMPLADGTALG